MEVLIWIAAITILVLVVAWIVLSALFVGVILKEVWEGVKEGIANSRSVRERTRERR